MGTRQRKVGLVVLFSAILLLFLGLAALNAFRLPFLTPATVTQIVAFTAVSVLAVLLFLVALLLLVRNTLRVYADRRSRVLGARLRTRMLIGALLVTVVPLVGMFGFGYLMLNRAVERWFSLPATALRDDSAQLAQELSNYVMANARAEAASVAASLTLPRHAASDPGQMRESDAEFKKHEATLQGGFVLIFQGGRVVQRFHSPTALSASLHAPLTVAPSDRPSPVPAVRGPVPLEAAVLEAARSGSDPLISIEDENYVAGSAWASGDLLVVVALPLPGSLSGDLERLRHDGDRYWTLYRARRQIRTTFMLLLLSVTAIALFSASWLALQLSRQVTRPVEALAQAMNAVAEGRYDHRVEASATEELGELAAVFNTMTTELEAGRRLVEQSTVDVVRANAALEARRLELETMLQTLPNGVVMLDAERMIRVANPAFSEMLDPGGQRSFIGEAIADVLPADTVEQLDRLLRRSHRMRAAAAEFEMATTSGNVNIAATVALMETATASGPVPTGYVVVLENATELLRAQKQSAWKEVARRVAHEIKNPLTPISLSAEQIQRHTGRVATLLAEHGLQSASTETIHHSAEVIRSSVESMRSLVDQFSSLAEFPHARPRPADLRAIVDNSLALFAGRLQGITVRHLPAANLPLVLADPEAMKRALSNLIDNAAEAMTTSLHREIRISTALSESAENMVELAVADTGPGVTEEMRERLFLPYFSTKQRGTGLGLTIVAKIIADHRGTIRAEQNTPRGARFVMELPVAAAAGSESAEQPVRSVTALQETAA